MSVRGLLVLILLLAGVVGLLVWLGREQPRPPDAAAPGAALLAAFREDELREIDAACASGAWTLGRVAPSGWRVTKPFEAEADPRRVHAVIAGLSDARAGKTVAEPGADAAAFGLEPPLCRASLTIDSEPTPREVRLGRSSPVGNERYALSSDGRVVLVDGSLFGLLAREPESFRERRLFPVEASSLTRMVIDRPDGRLVLAADDGVWRVLAPVQDAASSSSCESLARAIAAIEVENAGATTRPLVSRADRRIGIEVTSGRDATPRVGYLAAAAVAGARLGWRDGGALIGLVSESAARELEQGVEVFRSKRVATFSIPDVRWVAIERGRTSLRVERGAEGAAWRGHDGAAAFPVDGARVEAFLARLHQLTAVGFESAGSAGAATGSIVVGGEAGEICRIAWGPLAPTPRDGGESLWVATPPRPGVIFRVLATSLGPIPVSASDWAAGAGS